MVRLKLADFSGGDAENPAEFVSFPFYKDGSPIDVWHSPQGKEYSPRWGMTLRSAGSMRFRWNESNPLRDRLLSKIAGARSVVPVELIHSKIVYEVENAYGTNGRTGDGIVTANPQLMPVVTVADCVPLYVFDSVSGAFGAVHSGWKGTGIVGEAVHRLKKRWGAESSSVCAAIGAHIHDCCYIVGEERAAYFMQEFGEECCALTGAEETLCAGAAAAVSGWNTGSGRVYRLSLEKANLSVLERCGILPENIVILDECTCCNTFFGSNRRETAGGNASFTVQAAFVKM